MAGDVEDRLRAGADDGDRRPAELLEIGRDVEGRRARSARRAGDPSAAVDAADPAGGEDADARRMGGDHRRRDGRGRPAGRQRRGQARPGGLADRTGRRRRRAPRAQHRRARPGSGRRGSRRWPAPRPTPGRRPPTPRDLEVLGIRQAVADERRFEGDDRAGRRRAAFATVGATSGRSRRSHPIIGNPSSGRQLAAEVAQLASRRAMSRQGRAMQAVRGGATRGGAAASRR